MALRLACGGLSKPVIRVLERRPHPPFTGSSGVPRETALGLPRFRDAVFTGAYPFAHIRFQQPGLPVEVSLEAFNPMIPLETEDFGLPVALYTYTLTSRAASGLEATIAFSLMNPVGCDGVSRLRARRAPFFGQNLNEFRSEPDLRGLFLSSQKYPPDSVRYGSMALLTTGENVSCRLAWEHGAWWDEFQKWWDEFLSQGRFANAPVKASEDGATEYATLAASLTLQPEETKKITFVLAWHFPSTENYWNREKEHFGKPLRNWYGSRFPSAWEPAAYAARNLARLRQRSERYRELRFQPRMNSGGFRCLFSTGTSWRGYSQTVAQGKLEARIALEGGTLELAALRLPYAGAKPKLSASFKGAVTQETGEALVRPAAPLRLKPGDTMRLSLSDV